jgi:hypothetical protein
MPVILDPGAVLERPGVGVVISSAETYVSAARGVVGFLGRSRMGPMNTPVLCQSVAEVQRIFGGGPYGGDPTANNTTDGALEALRGGARGVWICRMGSGGTPSSHALTEAVGAGPEAILVEAKGPGADGDKISVQLQGATTDPTRALLIAFEGNVKEQISYTKGTPATEVDNLMAAYGRAGSDLVTLTKLATATGTSYLWECPMTELTGGIDPSILMADIETALEALGGRPFEVFAADFVEDAEVDLLVEIVNEWIFGGKLTMACFGAAPGMAWGTKQNRAIQINNPAFTYVCNGFITNTNFRGQSDFIVEGYEAAGREAGRLAALPLGRQLTHSVVHDAVESVDEPAPDVIAQSLRAGLYLYSTNSRGQVWTEQGLTIQSNPDMPPPWARQTDTGWRKQRLVLTRFRLLTDIELAVSPMIETTTNNAAGRESVRKQIQNVIDGQYVPTGAVEAGTTVVLHPDYPPSLDRVTYLISPLITPDGTEFIVIEAQFRR